MLRNNSMSKIFFALFGEIHLHIIRENDNMTVVRIHNAEFKSPYYVADTTSYLNADKNSLCCVIHVLDWYKRSLDLALIRVGPRLRKLVPKGTGV